MHVPDTRSSRADRTRAERTRGRRARYSKRGLTTAAVLVGRALGTEAYAGIFLGAGSRSEMSDPTAGAEEARSAGAPTDGVPGSTMICVENTADEPVPEQAAMAAENSLDVLVLGVDRRASEAVGTPSRSDSIMLARASPGGGRVRSLSVPRDLLVVQPGAEDRINTAYAHGGVEQAAAVMDHLTGIAVDRCAIVDFGGFEEAINALGGVTPEVEEPVRLGSGVS